MHELKSTALDVDANLLRLQVKALNEKLSKQAEIIKLLKESNDTYASSERWSHGSGNPIYMLQGRDDCGFDLARSIKKQVELLENEK